jgi:hypothetical protein
MATRSTLRPLRLNGATFSTPNHKSQLLLRGKGSWNKRFTSTTTTTTAAPPTAPAKPSKSRFRKYVFRTSLALVLFGGYLYVTDTRASVHKYVAVPLVRWLYPDAEDAHHAGVDGLKELYRLGLHPRERDSPDKDGKLATEVGNFKKKGEWQLQALEANSLAGLWIHTFQSYRHIWRSRQTC